MGAETIISKSEAIKTTNPKELNPYLGHDGSGYFDDAHHKEVASGQLLSYSDVGDGGASWRLKALKRAEEQAAREGRKLVEVVEERWGSLAHLATSVATCRAAPVHAHLHATKDRRNGWLEKSECVGGGEGKGGTEEVQHASCRHLQDIRNRHPDMRKPRQDTLLWRKNENQKFVSMGSPLMSAAIAAINKFSNDGSFMESMSCIQGKDADACDPYASKESTGQKNDMGSDNSMAASVKTQGLSKNYLAAKVLQHRMKGRYEEGKQISSQLNRREEHADVHLAQVHNKQYSKSGRDAEYDYECEPRDRKHKHKRAGVHEEQSKPKRIQTQQVRCHFCFENPARLNHPVVSIGNYTYMMLPQWQPVIEGHCCILPMQHDFSTRNVDMNVWEEIRNFKKCLLRMFAAQDKDVIFIETVIELSRQRRHCLIDCIPIDYAVSEKAPMYFKKAIEDAEDEWIQHDMKKVIPTNGNLRSVIPENFAYFHVEFGLDKGLVHVIDKDSNFSSSFGLNVIRGMLCLPAEEMHQRRRLESVEMQRQAVISFAREWEPYDWTKALD